METSTSMPIGYRFKPTDQELVSHYLNHRLLGNDAIVNNVIAHVHFLDFAPWKLPALSKVKSDDKEWFFFTCLDPMKSTKSKTRFNRKTNINKPETKTKDGYGYWKITGRDREIKTKSTNNVIGKKMTLVFYGNQHEKTNWVMHEYHSSFPDNKRNLVLCRLMEKVENKIEGVTDSSCHVSAAEKQLRVVLTPYNKQLHILDAMPIGYRFHPTDEELVNHYLRHKLVGNDSMVNNITSIDLEDTAPWDIPALSKVKSDDSEWFFFTSLDLKFNKSSKCNRKTNDGCWKITGKSRNIKTIGTNNLIGTKKVLVFYKGQKSPREKTNWVIHEYHAINSPNNKENIVLCRLTGEIEKQTEGLTHSSSHAATSIFGNIATMDSFPYVCSSPELNMEDFFQKSLMEEECSLNSLLQPATDQIQTPYFQGVCLENENSTGLDLPEASEEDSADDSSFVDSILDDGVFISEETS